MNDMNYIMEFSNLYILYTVYACVYEDSAIWCSDWTLCHFFGKKNARTCRYRCGVVNLNDFKCRVHYACVSGNFTATRVKWEKILVNIHPIECDFGKCWLCWKAMQNSTRNSSQGQTCRLKHPKRQSFFVLRN